MTALLMAWAMRQEELDDSIVLVYPLTVIFDALAIVFIFVG